MCVLCQTSICLISEDYELSSIFHHSKKTYKEKAALYTSLFSKPNRYNLSNFAIKNSFRNNKNSYIYFKMLIIKCAKNKNDI